MSSVVPVFWRASLSRISGIHPCPLHIGISPSEGGGRGEEGREGRGGEGRGRGGGEGRREEERGGGRRRGERKGRRGGEGRGRGGGKERGGEERGSDVCLHLRVHYQEVVHNYSYTWSTYHIL